MKLSPLAGKPVPPQLLIDVTKLVTAFFGDAPDAENPLQMVAFGVSGHSGSALMRSFNQAHVLANTDITDWIKTQADIFLASV